MSVLLSYNNKQQFPNDQTKWQQMSLVGRLTRARFAIIGVVFSAFTLCVLLPPPPISSSRFRYSTSIANLMRLAMEDNSPAKYDSQSSKKVIVLAYMRSGSTFLGELFNQNPEAFFWYEPIDGFYSYLYGTERGWHPLDISYNQSLKQRQIPGFEAEYLREGIQNLLNCNLISLPVQTTYDVTNLHQTAAASMYRNCLRKKMDIKSHATSNNPSAFTSSSCSSILKMICPQRFVGNSSHEPLQDCYKNLHINKSLLGYYRRYSDCIDVFAHQRDRCVDCLMDPCGKLQIRGFKTIRLPMNIMHNLLKNDKNIKIIHLIRDPRAIIYSRKRYGLMSSRAKVVNATESIIVESKLLCLKMMNDIQDRRTLQNTYPGTIVEVRYEQLASHPMKTLQEIYGFLSIQIPVSVARFISTRNTFDDGPYGTLRKNGSARPHMWKLALTNSQIDQINMNCNELLQYLQNET